MPKLSETEMQPKVSSF